MSAILGDSFSPWASVAANGSEDPARAYVGCNHPTIDRLFEPVGQIRQGHWAIVDLVGKGGHIRTVPVHNSVHSEPRLGTVPGDELLHSEPVFRIEFGELRLLSTEFCA